jgi:hypothetical protein
MYFSIKAVVNRVIQLDIHSSLNLREVERSGIGQGVGVSKELQNCSGKIIKV